MEEQKKFEEEYKAWIKSAAKDAAFVLKKLSYKDLAKIKRLYNQYSKDPASIFYEIQDKDRIEKLLGDRLEGILLLETEAVAFSTSIFMDTPGIFDYALAMNRRYFVRGRWFSIIALNSNFIKQARDIVLRYTIEHELLQEELYEERMKQGIKRFSHEEKRLINLEAMRLAVDKSGIGEEDLLSEKELMLTLSTSCPLVPKSFIDTALFKYVEKYWESLKYLGNRSRDEWEERLGEELSKDLPEWVGFLDEMFKVFYREVEIEMEEWEYI